MNNKTAKLIRKLVNKLAQPIIQADNLSPQQMRTAINRLEKQSKKAYKAMNWIQRTEFKKGIRANV